MRKLCPDSWSAKEITFNQFKDLVHVAGAWSALRSMDAAHMERRWAAMTDPDSAYAIDIPVKRRRTGHRQDIEDEEWMVKDRVERSKHHDEEKDVQGEVFRMLLEDETNAKLDEEPQNFGDLSAAMKAWDVVKSLTAGGIAGAIAKTVIAPLDRTKIIFQTTHQKFSARAVVHQLKAIYLEEGVTGWWRGHSATLARVMPYAGIQFVSFDFYKQSLLLPGEERLTPFRRLLAGSLAGGTSVLLTYPLDLMRARMSVQDLKTVGFRSTFGVIVRQEGLAGFYRGLAPTLLGIVPYAGLAFGTFETLKIMTTQHYHTNSVTAGQRFYCGVMAGFVAQTLTYPLDIVRRRMQTDGIHTHDPRSGAPPQRTYHTIRQTFLHVLTNEGWKGGLFKGVSMNWIKGPIAHGISFTTFDLLKRNFDIKPRTNP
eukprot:CAMPEP_0203774232 /NCGR_PEP_ID=MMETSP0099_2-20121227/5171_1 /ASSEMBLY_ACC=CAM_ASM_000209 /TAXON_ID=96639 /ORGANISM=" , Strain NY0313808BC1" /LENGTH=424 /DNA_ID=CAMNT_0050672295 /DNA_START=413 /DNA_END=1687 /DNA_ORIENTATION=+